MYPFQQYTRRKKWNVATATYVRQQVIPSVAATTLSGFAISDRGDKAFALQQTPPKVFEFNLSTPYDVSTVSLQDSTTFGINPARVARGLDVGGYFGKYLIIGIRDIDQVNSFNLTGNYDLTGWSWDGNYTMTTPTGKPDEDIALSDSGYRFYTADATYRNIYQNNLSAYRDVTSYNNQISYAMAGSTWNLYGLTCDHQGKWFVAVYYDPSSNKMWAQSYEASTYNKVTTLSNLGNALDLSSQLGTGAVNVRIAIPKHGGDFFYLARSTNNTVYQYRINK